MNKELINNLSYSTFLSLDYGKSSGSGFILIHQNSPYIVTAKHVLFDENDNLRATNLLITSQNSRGHESEARNIMIENLNQAPIYRSLVEDVAIINISNPALYTVQQEGNNIISVSMEQTNSIKDIGVSNDIYLVGFPTSLIFQGSQYFEVNRPLLRKGIIAGINSLDNTFIIDCTAYYGNSGAPIIEVCQDGELRIVGIVSRYIPFVTEWRNNREPSISHTELSNSGYTVCLPIDSIINLINISH